MSQEAVTAAVIARIRRARRKRGMTAQALADAISESGYEVSRASLAKAENGIRETISVDLVLHAARVLSVPPMSLFADEVWCKRCSDSPPPGFTCKECGADA